MGKLIGLTITAGLAAAAAWFVATEARKRGWVSDTAGQIFVAGAAGALVGKFIALK